MRSRDERHVSGTVGVYGLRGRRDLRRRRDDVLHMRRRELCAVGLGRMSDVCGRDVRDRGGGSLYHLQRRHGLRRRRGRMHGLRPRIHCGEPRSLGVRALRCGYLCDGSCGDRLYRMCGRDLFGGGRGVMRFVRQLRRRRSMHGRSLRSDERMYAQSRSDMHRRRRRCGQSRRDFWHPLEDDGCRTRKRHARRRPTKHAESRRRPDARTRRDGWVQRGPWGTVWSGAGRLRSLCDPGPAAPQGLERALPSRARR